ncbi:hypothetical protein [Breznakiella homolactica]|uniref:Uncharacterized protein n=1 Tax=Breznakiella homolactica TaxID=2798577 RepID=A0A7T7XMD6_9SPIR|nr:hypothetical protein [Breznakiella homolactica]QQO08872.1 hypothetical protein JFL75_18375 [Breznakiella homolactica]
MGTVMESGSGDDGISRMVQRMLGDLPLRALIMFSQGMVTPEHIQGILAAANAETGQT